MRLAIVVTGMVFLCVGVWGCSKPLTSRNEPVRVVHAVLSGADATAAPESKVLPALLKWIRFDAGPNPAALVLVTNFGPLATPATASQPPGSAAPKPTPQPAGPGNNAKAPAPPLTLPPTVLQRDAAAEQETAKRFVGLLKAASIDIPVYVVPGVQAVPDSNLATVLDGWRNVVAEMRKGLQESPASAQVIDLTSCYQADGSDDSGASCVAPLAGSNAHLVSYPGLYGPGTSAVQDKWANVFKAAMQTAGNSTTILVAPLRTGLEQRWSPEGTNTWMRAAGNAQIALGVEESSALRRSTYESNSVWKAAGLTGEWFLTPSLTSANPSVPGASIGASVVSVSASSGASRDVFWYADATSSFSGPFADEDVRASAGARSFWRWLVGPAIWLWELGSPIPTDSSKAFVLFIAMLAAFLTSVAVWQIPPATSSSVTSTTTTNESQTVTTSTTVPTIAKTALLDQNFARTVISGLGGLAVAVLMLDTFDIGEAKGESQQFYVVWFIVCFFVMLIGSSLWKGAAEGFRVINHVNRQPSSAPARWTRVKWFFLTWTDAFFNLIQGRNELKSTLWANEIQTVQLDLLVAIDRICEHLRAGFADYLNAPHVDCAGQPPSCCQHKRSAPPRPDPTGGGPPAEPAQPHAPTVPAQGASPRGSTNLPPTVSTPATDGAAERPADAAQISAPAEATKAPVDSTTAPPPGDANDARSIDPIAGAASDLVSGSLTGDVSKPQSAPALSGTNTALDLQSGTSQLTKAPASQLTTTPGHAPGSGPAEPNSTAPPNPSAPPNPPVLNPSAGGGALPPAAVVAPPATSSETGSTAKGPAAFDPTCVDQSRGRVEMSDIRVAVSVLSDDRKRVYYVSWPPESSSRDFSMKSIAYVSVAAGVVRWWVDRLQEASRAVVLLNNLEGANKLVPELADKSLLLDEFFASRGQDYKSFVVIPIPTRPTEGGRRAGLHISFKQPDGLYKVWSCVVPASLPATDGTGGPAYYDPAGELLDRTPPELKRLLRQSINVIESVLRNFNEEVFVNALHSRRRA